MAEFPYGQGNYVMDAILPDNNFSFNTIASDLSDQNFSSWPSQMTIQETDLSFPRFKYGYKKQLKEILSDMGMGIAFGDEADLSQISDFDLLINDVTHQALIETSEE
jgi:serine protease inhibitor